VRDQQIARERVMARHALAQEGDYFLLLGVDRQADATEIRRVHQRLLREISPEMLGPELTFELKQPIETVREVLDEGLRILCTPALRAAYELNLVQPSGEKAPPPEDPASALDDSSEKR
jgi:hypothetical protein